MNKKLVRYLIIVLAALLLAFVAKMEAINLYLAIPVGVSVTVVAFRFLGKMYELWNENEHGLLYGRLHWFIALPIGLLIELCLSPLYYLLPLVVGCLSGYAVYFTLNFLFISP